MGRHPHQYRNSIPFNHRSAHLLQLEIDYGLSQKQSQGAENPYPQFQLRQPDGNHERGGRAEQGQSPRHLRRHPGPAIGLTAGLNWTSGNFLDTLGTDL